MIIFFNVQFTIKRERAAKNGSFVCHTARGLQTSGNIRYSITIADVSLSIMRLEHYASTIVQPLGIPLAPVLQVLFGDFTNVPVADTFFNQSSVAYNPKFSPKHLT